MTDMVGQSRRQAGGVSGTLRAKLMLRGLPTSGLNRYMTKTHKIAQRSAARNTDKAGSVDKLHWLYAAWACSARQRRDQPQTGRSRQFVNTDSLLPIEFKLARAQPEPHGQKGMFNVVGRWKTPPQNTLTMLGGTRGRRTSTSTPAQ